MYSSYAFRAAILLAAVPSFAHADDAALAQRLALFKSNPKALLNTVPKKVTLSGEQTLEFFPPAAVKSRAFVAAKNQGREVLAGRAGIKSNDDPSKLVDNGDSMVTNLQDMEDKKLMEGEVKTQPWSDYYWALYNGNVAFRFADAKFPKDSENWLDKFNFLNSDDADKSETNALSPAEKYDLLVGDEGKSLTKYALAQGKQYYDQSGSVETWMGICHGWSPAAFMIDRPTSSVKVTAADGKTKITFYPSDIKALSSLLWANSPGETRFIGGRCNTKNPKTDANGRVKDQDCFDTNPGTWHQAVVNQIGVNKRSFVLDVTFDYEVWNQPAKSYSYTYFNPDTMKQTDSLKEAVVAIKDMKDDKFAKYRSKKAKYLAGVSMKFDYIVETFPKAAKSDAPANDAVREAAYEYDLELDADMNIVGGEWYENTHPDFLWTPAPDAKAQTVADEGLSGSWDGKSAMPKDWQAVAPRASQAGSPLATVVNALVNLSNK